MGLSSALAIAMAGLRTNQASLSIISGNVANAQTPGYVSQNANQIEVTTGAGDGSSVVTSGVSRELDLFVQNQLRTETSGGAYADQIANILGQLQSVYGTPGGDGSLEAALNSFTSALQALSSNPGNQSAQGVALTAAQSLAAVLNKTTQGIQSLRSNADQDIGTSADKANTLMAQIAQFNGQLQGLSQTDPQAATLMDQRDNAINELAKLVDVRAVTDSTNQVSVFTSQGIQLVGGSLASQFTYSSAGPLTATSLYDPNPQKSGVGSLKLRLPNGASIDVAGSGVISSGQIAADLKLRDQTLVQAQTQVDQLAATLASSASDQTTAGTAVTGPPSGFDVDVANVQPGNTVNLTYTDTTTNTQHQISIVNVTDPTALPLQNAPNANPQLVGVDFTGGMPAIVAALNTALGSSHLQFSNPPGPPATTLRVTDDGSGLAKVNAVSVTKTITSLASGNPQLPLFTDTNAFYTDQIKGTGAQMTGFAGRITVNAALLADPTKLSIYNTSPLTQPGDTTRTDFLYTQLTSTAFTYSPQTGLGSSGKPLQSSITGYLQQFISQQGNASTLATQLQQGQSVVVKTLQQKFDSTSAVSIDSEMSNLIAVQNNYAANAHIMSVVQTMMNTLLQAQL